MKKTAELIYPELSFKLVGILFDVNNKAGCGLRENVYQKLIAKELKNNNMIFREQVYCPIVIDAKTKIKNYFDFLIEEKIVLEIKAGENYNPENARQIITYLKASNMKLGIIANFTYKGLRFKRFVN